MKFLSKLDLTLNKSTTESYVGRYEFEDVSMSFKGSAKGVGLALNAYADELDQTTLTFTQAGRNIELRLNCN